MDAIVTAGGRIRGEFAARGGVTVKALLQVGGRPVIRTVVEALRSVPDVERIFAIGPESELRSLVGDSVDEIIPEVESGAENFLMGLERCSGDTAVFAASDLPFLTADAIQAFLSICPRDADFCYPILRREQFLGMYPGAHALFVRLKDASYTGGCVFQVRPRALLANRGLIERVFMARKSPLKLASILGWGFILRLVTGTADVDRLAKRGSEIVGCACAAVRDSPPEVAFDLDDLGDYEYAIRHVEE